MLILLRSSPNVIAVTAAAVLELSAADPTLSFGTATISPDNAVLTLSAQDVTLKETVLPDNAVLAFSAQDPTLAFATLTITPDTAVLALSGADVGIVEDLRKITFTINGIDRTRWCRLDGTSLDTLINDSVDTLGVIVNGRTLQGDAFDDGAFDDGAFEGEGFVPATGQEITVAQGSVNNLAFGGVIVEVDLVYTTESKNRVDYRLTCVDFGFRLAKELVTARYQSQSATAIGQALAALSPPGFTSATGIQGNLATIDDLEFVGTPLDEAFRILAQKFGGKCYFAPNKVTHLFVTETAEAPDPIDASHPVRELSVKKDGSQIRTRVFVSGRGSQVTSDVAVGCPTVPLEDASAFRSVGGSARVGSQVLTYASLSSNNRKGSNVVGPKLTPSTPSAAILSPSKSGGVLGSVRYAVSNVIDDRGETDLSALSSVVTVPAFAPPVAGQANIQDQGSAGVLITRTGSQAVITGMPFFRVLPGATIQLTDTASGAFDGTFQVAALDSVGNPIISGVSTSAPTASGGTVKLIMTGPLVGQKFYALTYESDDGETVTGTPFQVNQQPQGLAFSVGGTLTPGTGGALTPNTTYTYWMAAVTTAGEGALATINATSLSGEQNRVTVNSIPPQFDTRVIGIRLYRNRAGDSLPRLLATLDLTTTSYVDNTADTGLGALPMVTEDATGCAIGLFALPVSSDPRVKRRQLYRERTAGGSVTTGRVATLDNTQTWFLDTVPDGKLGDAQPTENKFGGATIDVTVPAGPVGTQSRKVWRTVDGGAWPFVFLVGTLSDNIAVTLRDKRADKDLVEVPGNDNNDSQLKTLEASTSLRVLSATNFAQAGGGGWVKVGSQLIRYTGITGDALTGIPASGPGSITAPIAYDADILVEPHLRGIPTSGAGSIVRALTKGDAVRLFVQVDDVPAQTALAAQDGTDGIRKHEIGNDDWSYEASLLAGQADLALNSRERITITFKRRDYKLAVGKSIVVDILAPTSLSGTYTITQVTMQDMGMHPKLYAERHATATNVPPLSFEDYLRRLLLTAA